MQKTKFEWTQEGWLVTQDGKLVFKKRPTGKMRAVKAVIANLTKSSKLFTISIEVDNEAK